MWHTLMAWLSFHDHSVVAKHVICYLGHRSQSSGCVTIP